ncbi:CG21 [Hepatospora eriocheir]|uniref:CG21 n=1 Tax=Hepatospora eriocheir TaxID=1081669 RepID=A0A1X0QKS5_9MICR|nr:CG21 [Hepatospora eriocheir]
MTTKKNGILRKSNLNMRIELEEKTNIQRRLSNAERKAFSQYNKVEEEELRFLHKYAKALEEHYDTLNELHEKYTIMCPLYTDLFDFIIGVHYKLSLQDDTLYVCFNILLDFLSKKTVSKSKLKLLGLGSLFIAVKYEEVEPSTLPVLMNASETDFTSKEIIEAERYILKSIDYTLDFVNPLFFLRRASKANGYELKSRTVAKYFLELMFLYREFYDFDSNVVASSAMFLARKVTSEDIHRNLFFTYTKVDKSEMGECLKLLLDLLIKEPVHTELNNKYSKSKKHNTIKLVRNYLLKKE